MFSFKLTDTQIQQLDKWQKEQNKKAVERQKQTTSNPSAVVQSCWENGYPYGGAAGGSLTYSFTPTNIGMVVKVTDGFTDETVDLSDYEDW